MAYEVKLEVFEGPFDLLFHLIEKNEVDIYQIPIAKIANEYLAYIKRWQSFDLEVASEFLVMAASLLAMKANLLLPQPTEDDEEAIHFIETEEELSARLMEYRKFKLIAEVFRQKELSRGRIYTREAVEVWESTSARQVCLEGLSLQELLKAFQRVFDRAAAREMQLNLKDTKSVREKLEEICEKLSTMEGNIPFEALFSEPITKTEVIVTFLALLELIRLRRIVIFQERTFGKITVFAIKTATSEAFEDD